MKILVLNVTNWIGYHMTDGLLNAGHEVVGVKGEEGNEHFIDFFARNSQFHLIERPERGSFPLVICIEDADVADDVEYDRLYLINHKEKRKNAISIEAPCLFGEWMPMTEEDLEQMGENVTFSSEKLLSDGIYIGDFLEFFITFIEKEPEVENIRLWPARNQGKKLEKSFLVDENIPIQEKLQQVISHYKRFKDLYPQNMRNMDGSGSS